MGLYVEALVRADMDVVWERTREPRAHRRWDLRFGEIEYLPGDGPQRFRYATLGVSGVGVTAGERHRPDGTRTSALRFRSEHPLSLIEEGSGYWRYVPVEGGVRFLTGYDYTPRWGRFGHVVDRLVFRPLMGWATAWSFDRLRLWCERGITPGRSLTYALAEVAGRLLAVVLGATLSPVFLLVLLSPPSPVTPAARRCRRRPPERVRAPRLLATLEKA